MFFRRKRPTVVNFDERLEALRSAGFDVGTRGPGLSRIRRGRCAADIEELPGGASRIRRAGILVENEIASLVDGGFQKFFLTEDGKQAPALAQDLMALHDFEEEVRSALGLVSLYNQSLGTTCDLHLYDRLEGRG